MHQCKSVIRYLNAGGRVKPAHCQIASFYHHPVTFCVHISCLTAGQPRLPWPFAAVLLFCFERLYNSWRGDAVSWFSLTIWKKKNQKNIHSTVFPCLYVKQTSGSTVSFGVDRRKCGRARGAEWALSIENTFLKAAEPCDFSSLSQGLGYSVCLCELMLWRAQCLSNPAEHRYIIGSCREDKWSSLAQMTEHPVVLTPFFQRTYCVSCLNSQVCPHTERFWT